METPLFLNPIKCLYHTKRPLNERHLISIYNGVRCLRCYSLIHIVESVSLITENTIRTSTYSLH